MTRRLRDRTPEEQKAYKRWLEGNGQPEPAAKKRKTTKRQSQRRFELLNWFADTQASQCSRSEQVVWLQLYRHTRGSLVSISQDQLVKCTGLSRRAVVYAIQGLRRKKLVAIIKRGEHKQSFSQYKLTTQQMP